MLLLDTHVMLGLIGGGNPALQDVRQERLFVSVASLWEVAIKVRLGKLELTVPLSDLDAQLEELGCTVSEVRASHAIADADPWPDTNDPFDRLLLAVCQVEGLRLVTRDRKLVGHPLAWRPPSA